MERIFFEKFCLGTSKYKIGDLHNSVADFEKNIIMYSIEMHT